MRFAKLGQFSYNTFVQLVGKALFTCVVYTNDRHILIRKIKGIECLATMVQNYSTSLYLWKGLMKRQP